MGSSASQRRERRRRVHAPEARRALTWGLALGLLGAAGAWSGAAARDPADGLTWLALWSAPCGCLIGALRVGLLRYGAVAPGIWMFAFVSTEAARDVPLESPASAVMAWTGLFAAGVALGRLFPAARWSVSASLLLLGLTLVALPARAGAAGRPWPPRAAELLLDLSPAALVCESAGLRDWMWRPGLYEPAGTDRLSRTPWRGSLAGPACLVVGCALAALAARLRPVARPSE